MMEPNRSGLQTSRNYSQPDPAQRHQANKQTLNRYFQDIHSSLARESKLQNLQESSYLNHYKTNHYWSVVKYSSNEEDKLNEEIGRMKVSNRQFIEITADEKEVEFDLVSTMAVYLQRRSDYDLHKDTLDMTQQIELEHQNQNNAAYKNQIQGIKAQHKQLFGVETSWHYPKAELRIIVLVRDQIDKDKMLMIYNRQTDVYRPIIRGSTMEASLFKESDEDMARNMQELIKCHMVRQSNQKQLNNFKNMYLSSIKNDISDKLSIFLQNQNRSQKKLTGNLALVESFRFYDRLQSEDMLTRWKNKAAQHGSNRHLVVQVSEIYIKSSLRPKGGVALLLQNRKDQSTEQYRKKYEFKEEQGEYSVYTIANSERQKCSSFQLSKKSRMKEIHIRAELSGERNGRTIYEHQFVYFKLEGDDAFPHHITLHNPDEEGNSQQNVFVVLKSLETHSPQHNSLEQNHHRSLFNKVGCIPTKYRSTLKINYNPNTYPVVRQLLAPHLPAKLTKQSYQQCYYELVSFIQAEQNKSQMSLAHLSLGKITHKAPMRERLSYYERQFLRNIGDSNLSSKGINLYDDKSKLSEEERKMISFLNSLDNRLFGQLCGKEFEVDQVQLKNMKGDLLYYDPLNITLVEHLLTKLLHFVSRLPVLKQFSYPLRYSPHLIPILEKYVLIFFNSKQSNDEDMADRTKHTAHFFSFVLFLAKVYPYSQPNILKNDLVALRWLAQDKLSHYNDYLNRNHIGLENIIAPHLLNFFSDLSEELTFRIWDFLVSCDNINKARVVIAFTLLTYLETTRNLPIIPINQFMDSVSKNYSSLPLNIVPPASLTKAVDAFLAGQNSKTRRIQKLVENKDHTIVDDRQLQKIIMGDTFLNSEKQKRIQQHYKSNKMVQPIKEISYPLPKPGHFGHPIHEVIIFLHNLNILENLNLLSQKYVLRFQVAEAKGQTTFEVPILSKNHFYNQSFKIPLMPHVEDIHDKEERRNIVVLIVRKGGREAIELAGSFNYSHYHKDKAYKIPVHMQSNNKHNKGETVLHLTFCMKSSIHNSKAEENDFTPVEKLSQQYLDYDMGDSNQAIRHVRQLFDAFEQMKNPLDEFSNQQSKRLRNSALNFHHAHWLEHSKVTVEELKTIFYHIFPQEKDHDLKLQFSKIYQIFSEEHQMQFVHLAQIMTKLILSVNITRKKKLTYLYCLGVHYQNTHSKKITVQTINSMIRLILKQQGFVSPCPYDFDTCGKIVQAYFFCSSLKMTEEKNDFTEILQDLAYICNYKYEFNAIILGIGNNLSLLRMLFDPATLSKIQSQPECRFEIIYEIQGKKYIWCAVVDTKTFEIVKRGTKFLNNFDGYCNLKYLDSTQEYLYSCENIIPLHAHKSYNYSEFTQVMLQNTLVRYALDMPSQMVRNDGKVEIVRTKDLDQTSSRRSSQVESNPMGHKDQRIVDLEESENYESWALHRSQNCLESWRKCQIVNPGPVLSEIKYAGDQDVSTISTLDLISMDQIELDLEIKKQIVRIITG